MPYLIRGLLAGAAVVAFAMPAQAACGDVRACAGERVCGQYGEKCGIQRCHYWIDPPTCLY